MNLADRERAFLRAELARNAGIYLDDKPEAKPVVAHERPVVTEDDLVAMREILVAAGAPDRDLEWLVASCPSIGHAMTYKATELYKPEPTFGFFTGTTPIGDDA